MSADIDPRVIAEMASAGPVKVTFKSGIKVRVPDADHVRLEPDGLAELTTADGWQSCAHPGRVAAFEPAGPGDVPPSGFPCWR
jgi:hypothetical protein